MVKVYDFYDMGDGSWIVRIVYLFYVFEEVNFLGFFVSIVGNIFGMKCVKGFCFEDFYFLEKFIREFDGLVFGIEGVRKMFEIKDRFIYGVVLKLKVGYFLEEFEKLVYDFFLNGVDYMKDDENFMSLWYNCFEERVEIMVKIIDKVENEMGEKKIWFVNIIVDFFEME